MRIPLTEEVAAEIEARLAKFSRGWKNLDPLRRAVAFKVLVLCEMLGGRGKAAEAVEVADNTLDNYRHGKKDPTFVKLQSMAEKAGIAVRYLSGDWFFERDSIRIELPEPSRYSGGNSAPGLMDSAPESYFQGYDEVRPGQTAAGLLEDYWAQLGMRPGSLATFIAAGDSMRPTIDDRSPVFVDTADRDLSDGAIYAMKLKDGLLIRRVQRLAGGGLQLLADNQAAYPPQHVEPEKISELEVVGRVRGGTVAF